MKTVAIVAGAGYGKRLGSPAKKPFVRLDGRPLIIYSLKALDSSPSIDGIIVAVERSCLERFRGLIKKYRLKKVMHVVAGGKTRYESVRKCLGKVDTSFDIVLVHDAARPLVDAGLIRRSVDLAGRFGGCVVAVPAKDTVKLAGTGLFVYKTVPRSRVWAAQTPQTFRRALIVKAYNNAPRDGSKITDDSFLLERLGGRVKILPGSYRNIKITTKEDLALARALLRDKG